EGPWAAHAGHDINYLSVVGVLDNIGPADGPPTPPLNLVADYGGGSMFLALGVTAALLERERSGEGQIIDAAMVDGVSVLAQLMWSRRAQGAWAPGRGANVVDGSVPFYTTYRCSDGRYVAVGASEPQFFAALLAGLDMDAEALPAQRDRSGWPELRHRLATAFEQRSRDAWAAHFERIDACVTPGRSFDEAVAHPQLAARRTVSDIGGVDQPAVAPRFSRSAAPVPRPPEAVSSLHEVIERWRSSGGESVREA